MFDDRVREIPSFRDSVPDGIHQTEVLLESRLASAVMEIFLRKRRPTLV